MDENLVGYLLEALDAEDRRKVEHFLRTNPEGHRRLDLIRKSLEPLAADDDIIQPPPGLWVRTLARVAQKRSASLPQAPATFAFPTSPHAGRNWWRRSDVMAAASLLLFAFLLIPPGLNYLRYRYQITACQNNLRLFYNALENFSENHRGEFPNVAAAEPRNVAGIFVPILNEDGFLPQTVSVACPAQGIEPPPALKLKDAEKMDGVEFDRYIASITSGYAYSLGYLGPDGRLYGLHRDPNHSNNSFMPVMADCPPGEIGLESQANSPNHNGRGQNVLYVDGHCTFGTVRTLGYNFDDIYLNHDRKVAAGKDIWDAVLANGGAKP